MAADVKPMPDAQAIYGLIRNTEIYEIRILLYKQPPNCAHIMTYVSTYSRHKNLEKKTLISNLKYKIGTVGNRTPTYSVEAATFVTRPQQHKNENLCLKTEFIVPIQRIYIYKSDKS